MASEYDVPMLEGESQEEWLERVLRERAAARAALAALPTSMRLRGAALELVRAVRDEALAVDPVWLRHYQAGFGVDAPTQR